MKKEGKMKRGKNIELKDLIQFAQREFGIDDDGVIGRDTIGNANRLPELIQAIGRRWSAERKLVGFVQHKALSLGIDAGKIDGYLGEQTRYAFELLLHFKKYGSLPTIWRDEDNDWGDNYLPDRTANPNNFPTYNLLDKVYGKSGSNLVTVPTPYPLKLAWNPSKIVTRLTCHKMVSSSLLGVLEGMKDHYSFSGLSDLGLDLYGGVYNKRKMRGGSKLSTHAWGVAIDLDPDHNQLKWDHTRARFAKSEYQFMRNAFGEEGWVSLGESKDYDWMHFQAVRL
jgi:hypothetical protein